MSKRAFILSTLSAPQCYQNYKDGAADLPIPVGEAVVVNGGANLATKALHTPRGVVTEVSEEQLAYLGENRHFKEHCANGFIEILDADPRNVDKAAANLEGKDKSAPLTPSDFVDAGGPKPADKSKK